MKTHFLPSQQPCFLSVFLVSPFQSLWTIMKWYLIAVLTCISLMTNDIGYLFVCLTAFCIVSLEKCLFRFFVHFKNGIVFLLLTLKNSLYILFILSCQIHYLNIFSPISWIVFSLSWWYTSQQKSFSFSWSPKYLFFFGYLCFWCHN